METLLVTLNAPTNVAWGIWPTRQRAGISRNAMTRKAAAAAGDKLLHTIPRPLAMDQQKPTLVHDTVPTLRSLLFFFSLHF